MPGKCEGVGMMRFSHVSIILLADPKQVRFIARNGVDFVMTRKLMLEGKHPDKLMNNKSTVDNVITTVKPYYETVEDFCLQRISGIIYKESYNLKVNNVSEWARGQE